MKSHVFFISSMLFFLDYPLNATGVESEQVSGNVQPSVVTNSSTHRIINLAEGVNIPTLLYLDDQKPIDEGEDQIITEKLIGNIFSTESEIPFKSLPMEVQELVQLTTGERYITEKFALCVVLSHDPAKENRSVKTYIYTPIIFDTNINAETLAIDNWRFKRQDNILKLETAFLDVMKKD